MEMAAELRLVSEQEPALEASLDFEAFFAREGEMLLRRLWLVTRDRREAEDLVQDAFIVVLERWGRVQTMDDPTGYLYRVAFNAWRKRARRAARAFPRPAGRPTGPQDPFAGAEARTIIGSALESLTPRQRAALVLTELLEMTSEEASSVLGVRPVTVRVLSSQARASMRERIGVVDG
jgi:RNA polymerase sigma-70 factor (ECF subfamily)